MSRYILCCLLLVSSSFSMAQITREKSNEMEMDRRQVTQIPATPLELDMWQKIESNTSVKERAKGAEEY